MKKILSFSLILSMLLTVLMLPACKHTTPPEEGVSNVPSDPTEAFFAVMEETAKLFKNDSEKESFDYSNGAKINFTFDATQLARVKLDADIIASAKDNYLLSLNLNQLSFAATKYEGLRLCITSNEIIAGFDSLLSRNFGIKFNEAEKQITDIASKLFPTVSTAEINATVKALLEQLKQALHPTASSQPTTLPDELKKEILALAKENIRLEFTETGASSAIQLTIDLRNVLNLVEGTVRILNSNEAWKSYISSLDDSLKQAVSENVTIPADSTALEYFLNEFESSLADKGCTPADVKLVTAVKFSSETLLLSDVTTALSVKEKAAFSLNILATYETAPTITLSVRSFENEYLGIEKEEDIAEIIYQSYAKTSETEGFSLTITDKTAKNNSSSKSNEADDSVVYEAIVLSYNKDLKTNEYEFKLYGKAIGEDKTSKLLTVAGRSYSTKAESFFSIDEIGSSTIGVTLMVDISIKTTVPTEADLKAPAYDDLNTITDAELATITKFIESLFPDQDSSGSNGIIKKFGRS